jgi:hypothetical protein
MRFTLPALLGLTLLTWHQALALPATPTKIAKVERDITTPYNVTALQGVDGDGASLGTSGGATWSSTPLQTRLEVVLPLAIANAMEIMTPVVDWKLLLTYTGDSNGNGHFYYNAYPDGMQTLREIEMCLTSPGKLVGTGTSGGNAWVQVKIPLEVAWLDTITGQLVAVFWTATYQFGQNDPDLSHTFYMNIAPSGWENGGTLPTTGCPPSGVGTAFTPASWSFLPWSTIISNLH